MSRKPTFFERLTGAIRVDDDVIREEEVHDSEKHLEVRQEVEEEGQLTVDMHETDNEIVIKTIVAGVRPEDLDISITREMVTIKGRREGDRSISDDKYYHRELYWGTFSRTILLPAEIEVEEAQAFEKHGLLIIRLPKINKNRQAKLRVKSQ